MSQAIGAPVPPELSRPQAWLRNGLCLLAIALVVAATIRPSGLYGDDEQYLYLVKGFFTGHAFENLHDMDGSLFLLRPLGYPLLLTLFYPALHQHWELYPWINAGFCALLGMVTFAMLRIRLSRLTALLVTIAMLANPMIRFWSTNAYSDISFAFFLMLFFWLHQTRRLGFLLPLFAVFLVSMRTSGIPLAMAFGASLAWKREWIRLGVLGALLAAYFGIQQWHFGEIPGLQEYFRIHVQDSTNAEHVPLAARMFHNLRSLACTLMTSTFFYGGYALMHASLLKTLLGLAGAAAVAFLLAMTAGRSVLLNVFIAGYFGVMLVMRPEDLVNRILIPLIPLVFLGAGRFAAVATTLYFPRLRLASLGLVLLCALDGVLSLPAYRKEFTARDFGDVYRAGDAPAGEAHAGEAHAGEAHAGEAQASEAQASEPRAGETRTGGNGRTKAGAQAMEADAGRTP
jgi:hypothetical protein